VLVYEYFGDEELKLDGSIIVCTEDIPFAWEYVCDDVFLVTKPEY
jgi:hypothetical protein